MLTNELIEGFWGGKNYLARVNDYGIAVVVEPQPGLTKTNTNPLPADPNDRQNQAMLEVLKTRDRLFGLDRIPAAVRIFA